MLKTIKIMNDLYHTTISTGLTYLVLKVNHFLLLLLWAEKAENLVQDLCD